MMAVALFLLEVVFGLGLLMFAVSLALLIVWLGWIILIATLQLVFGRD